MEIRCVLTCDYANKVSLFLELSQTSNSYWPRNARMSSRHYMYKSSLESFPSAQCVSVTVKLAFNFLLPNDEGA